MSRHTLYHNLHEAFSGRGCPVCRLSSATVDRYLQSLLYQSVNDLDVRRYIRRSQGFCSEHAWALLERGDALGIAIIHQDVIVNIRRKLVAERPRYPRGTARLWLRAAVPRMAVQAIRRIARSIAPTETCQACAKRGAARDAYLETLLQHTRDPQMLSAWRASDGLCWPHFRRLVELVRDEDSLEVAIEMELAHLGQLGSELREFISRHDYRIGSTGFGAESDSWRRAVAAVSGWQDET